MFDPYEQWLGIGKDQRPVTCYQLLGIAPAETNAKAIEKAAEKVAAKLHRFRAGEHAQACARLMKEIEQATAVLLDPVKRKAYDAKLRARTGGVAESADKPAAAVQTTTDVHAKAAPPKTAASKDDAEKPRKSRKSKEEPRPKKSGAIWVIVGGLVLVMMLGGGAIGAYLFFSQSSKPTQVVLVPPTKSEPPPNPPTKSDPPKPKEQAPSDPPKPSEPPPKPVPPKPAPPPPKPVPPKPEPPKVVKLSIPDEAAQAKAEAALKETWKTDYSRTRPEERATLSGKFLHPGREDRKDPAAWFVMLREARELALLAGKTRLAMEAIDEMDRWFVIDALDMKVKALLTLSKEKNESTQLAAVRVCQHMIEQAYSAENYELVQRLLKIAADIVPEVKGGRIGDIVRQVRIEVTDYSRDFQNVTAARATLAQAPENAMANEIVGAYLCFFQGDWAKGLPHLAKGPNGDLTNLAKLELSQPADVASQLKIADGWWDLVAAQNDRAQRHLLAHAKASYAKAGPGTAGMDRQKVVERIHEAQDREYARVTRLIPGSYFGRDAESRTLLLREGGGNMRSEEAIQLGLEWLRQHQLPNGMWPTDFKCKCTEPSDVGQKHDIAGTAFGLLPFLGAGHTHKQGRYQAVVARGLDFLVRKQTAKGNFHDNAYENALATIAVVECFGLTKDTGLQLPALAAARYIIESQSRDGSWGYAANAEKGDTSISGWQFTALKAAAYAKLGVPQETFDRLSAFLDSVADTGGLGYGYNSRSAGLSTSAAGVLCREFLSWGPGHPALKKEADHVLHANHYPKKEQISMYAVFYQTQVAHHLGGDHWEKWHGTVRDLLIDLQDKGDDPKHAHQKGSWSPRNDPYAKQGGRLMFTALALITLEAYYYHVPLYGYGKSVLED